MSIFIAITLTLIFIPETSIDCSDEKIYIDMFIMAGKDKVIKDYKGEYPQHICQKMMSKSIKLWMEMLLS